jgi:hypothetical protein
MKTVHHGDTWGDWELNAKNLTLYLKSHSYEIDLEAITDSAKMLDWIFQIRMKAWSTNDIIGDLSSAFQDIFRPQGTLCGMGIGKTIDAADYLKRKLGQM